MAKTSILEKTLNRDRFILIGGLIGIIAISWIYILMGAGMNMSTQEMTGTAQSPEMSNMMMSPITWTLNYALLMFFMWWIMMIAMMLPSASPTILLYGLVSKKNYNQKQGILLTSIFTWGYIIIWGVFSIVATALQWYFESIDLLTPMMSSSSNIFGSSILITAGLYQLTPLKRSCLRLCQHPIQFLNSHWHKGKIGAFRMGIFHGTYCLACCWFLMGLLFFGGVMNLYWITGLTIYVLLEKLIPSKHWLGTLSGITLIIWGILLIA